MASVLNPIEVEPVIVSLSPDITIEIDPRLELLAGVQAWTGWTAVGAPGDWGMNPPAYARELKEFFAIHKESEAIRLSEFLRVNGFVHDAPVSLMIHTDHYFAFERPSNGFSEYLVQRAGNEKDLLDFTEALRRLAAESNFASFFNNHRAYYRGLLARHSSGSKAARICQWLNGYFGAEGRHVYHSVLAPALLEGGGYGASRTTLENDAPVPHIYQFVCGEESLNRVDLDLFGLHEFGHSFVNPAIGDAIPAEIRPALEKIFAPVSELMNLRYYGDLETFLNEMVLRATTVRAEVILGLITSGAVDDCLEKERVEGFYPIKPVYQILLEYENDRSTWKNIRAFGPILLRKLADQADQLVDEGSHHFQATPIDSLHTHFENLTVAPGPGLFLVVGATSGGTNVPSDVLIEHEPLASISSFLTIRGNAQTSIWYAVGTDLLVRRGTLRLSLSVRGKNIHREGNQFDNAWAGFITENKDGNRQWHCHPYVGSFGWKKEVIKLNVNPNQIRSIRFGVFLSMSGALSIGNLDIGWV